MRKVMLVVPIALLLAMGLIVGCASEPESEKKDTGGLPEFYLNPPQADDAIYGVGSAKMSRLDTSRRMAISRAREDIAFQMRAAIEASITDYAQESGADGESQVVEFVETVSRQTTDTTLQNTRTEEVEQGDDGTVYALVTFPTSEFKDAASEAFQRNEDAAFAEFKADQALEGLDKQMEDQPPKAGNIEGEEQ